MSFSYDLASADTDTLNVSKVRLEIDDTVYAAGVKPDGTNFTDEEIMIWLDREGDDVMRAVASACEVLARGWARVADIAVGPRRESLGQVAQRYAEQAKSLRTQYGGGDRTFSATLNRQDGYHDAAELAEPYAGEME